MTTTVNQKVANPSFPTGGASGTTGTGNLVFSESPTINNANLTGNVSANVNLRSGTLATLLPLAGGASEIGYATDANALVRFNGTAGGAEVLTGGATKVFTLTDANVAAYTTGASFIDCANVSYLIINCAFVANPELNFSNINIKFPDSRKIPKFTVVKAGNGVFGPNLFGIGPVITPAYQTGDPITYYEINADLAQYTSPNIPPTPPVATISASGNAQFAIEFIAGAYSWTRTPMPWEIKSSSDNSPVQKGNIGYSIQQETIAGTALSSNINTQIGTAFLIDYGSWMVNWVVEFTSTNATALNATQVMAGLSGDNIITPYFPMRGITQITNLANTNSVSVSGFYYNNTGDETLYITARATISTGSVSAKSYVRAVRIG